MIPTFDEYQKAKNIIIAYEEEQNRLENIKIESFRKDLEYFFQNNSKLIINEFYLDNKWGIYNIVPISPDLDEMYDGELDDDIEILCEKHNIKASIIYWCYHK